VSILRPLPSATGLVAWVVAALMLAACTSAPPLPDPVAVETCDELEDVGVQLVAAWVHVVDQIPFDAVVADPPVPEVAELARIGGELDATASRLGCDAAELNSAIRERVLGEGDIQPGTPMGELLLELVGEGVIGTLPPAPPPTTTTTAGSS